MMDSTDRVCRYICGEMSKRDTRKLLLELKSNSCLERELQLQRVIADYFQNERLQQFRELLRNIIEAEKKANKRKCVQLFMKLAVAASLAIFCCLKVFG